MATNLVNMEIEEISLVPDPANEEARVVLVKSKGGAPGAEGDGKGKGAPPWLPKKKGDAEDSEDGEDDESAEGEKMTPAKKSAVIAKALRDAMADLAPHIITKALAATDPTDSSVRAEAQTTLENTLMDLNSLAAALDEAGEKIEALTKRAEIAEAGLAIEVAKAKAPATEEDILKALPEAVRERIQKAEAKAAELQTAADTQAAIAKARSFGFGEAEVIGPVLLRMEKAAPLPGDSKVIEAILKQAAAMEKYGRPFAVIGSTTAAEGSPDEILKAKVVEIAKERGLTEAQATDAALQENPGLYADIVAAKRAA